MEKLLRWLRSLWRSVCRRDKVMYIGGSDTLPPPLPRDQELLSDVLGTDGDVVMRPIEADVDRQLLQTAVSHLSPRERDIITMRFGLGGVKELTQKEVADQLGISQSYISRLEKRIILRLRRELQKMS